MASQEENKEIAYFRPGYGYLVQGLELDGDWGKEDRRIQFTFKNVLI